MMKLTIGEQEYRVKFGFNSFCDTDLMERVNGMTKLFQDDNTDAMSRIKDLFSITRELLFIGFKRFNPVASEEEVGDLLDQYMEEAEDEEDRDILALFGMLANELTNEGFLSSLLRRANNVPQDHKKKSPKTK